MTLTVTVAICTIPGREALLERAAASVAAQTVAPDVVVIELDAVRAGAALTRRRALARVTTDYVAWLDDDDEMLPRHLEACLDVASRTGADVVYPWFVADPSGSDNLRCAGPDGTVTSPFGLEFSEPMRRQLAAGHNFLHLCALIRTSALRATGIPALGPRGSQEDAGAYQALALAGATFVHVPERTWIWHRGAQSTGGRGGKSGVATPIG